VSAPATAGSTVAVTSWSTLVLPARNLEAVLAHELALPRRVSLFVYCLSLPARLVGPVGLEPTTRGFLRPLAGRFRLVPDQRV
jgi:hypothetical protein